MTHKHIPGLIITVVLLALFVPLSQVYAEQREGATIYVGVSGGVVRVRVVVVDDAYSAQYNSTLRLLLGGDKMVYNVVHNVNRTGFVAWEFNESKIEVLLDAQNRSFAVIKTMYWDKTFPSGIRLLAEHIVEQNVSFVNETACKHVLVLLRGGKLLNATTGELIRDDGMGVDYKDEHVDRVAGLCGVFSAIVYGRTSIKYEGYEYDGYRVGEDMYVENITLYFSGDPREFVELYGSDATKEPDLLLHRNYLGGDVVTIIPVYMEVFREHIVIPSEIVDNINGFESVRETVLAPVKVYDGVLSDLAGVLLKLYPEDTRVILNINGEQKQITLGELKEIKIAITGTTTTTSTPTTQGVSGTAMETTTGDGEGGINIMIYGVVAIILVAGVIIIYVVKKR